MDQLFLIAIGGNTRSERGDPPETIDAALRHLEAEGAKIEAVSAAYLTPAFPKGSGPDFVNAAATLRMTGHPEDVLARLHATEAAFGRRREVRWGPRTLDLDLIAAGNLVLPDTATHAAWRGLDAAAQQLRSPDQLILPHPRMHERAFVLVPLADVAPDWCHPLLNKTVLQMLAELPAEARAEVALMPIPRL